MVAVVTAKQPDIWLTIHQLTCSQLFSLALPSLLQPTSEGIELDRSNDQAQAAAAAEKIVVD